MRTVNNYEGKPGDVGDVDFYVTLLSSKVASFQKMIDNS